MATKLTPQEWIRHQLHAGQQLTIQQIQLATGISERQVRRHLHRLSQEGLPIEQVRTGLYKVFSLPPERQQVIVPPFEQHFGFKPRPLQQIACGLPLQADKANLVIVEGPTGEGKTESAFYLTARLGGGVYVAMPSQATSDGLFPRLKNFIKGDPEENLRAAHVGETAALRLVHGNDLLHDDALSLLAVEQSTAFVDDPAANDLTVTDSQAKSRVLG